MKRTIIKIDDSRCNGCGLCVKGCHEGALQLIEGKAVLVSELYCDGLGACLGECPQQAIELEEREAEAYDERKVMQRLLPKGEKVISAHLRHLATQGQQDYLQQAIDVLEESQKQAIGIPASAQSQTDTFTSPVSMPSELQQWPVQLHLLSPTAPWLKKANLLVAADCTAYSAGDFHTNWLRGKRLAIACPKLDHGQEIYLEKLITMIDEGGIDTLTVMIMEVLQWVIAPLPESPSKSKTQHSFKDGQNQPTGRNFRRNMAIRLLFTYKVKGIQINKML